MIFIIHPMLPLPLRSARIAPADGGRRGGRALLSQECLTGIGCFVYCSVVCLCICLYLLIIVLNVCFSCSLVACVYAWHGLDTSWAMPSLARVRGTRREERLSLFARPSVDSRCLLQSHAKGTQKVVRVTGVCERNTHPTHDYFRSPPVTPPTNCRCSWTWTCASRVQPASDVHTVFSNSIITPIRLLLQLDYYSNCPKRPSPGSPPSSKEIWQ